MEAVEWALPLEYGFTIFHVVNAYTKADQYEMLSAENRYKHEGFYTKLYFFIFR